MAPLLLYPHMAPKLHYFNPGHETAVLDGSPNYTPTKVVQKMTNELAYLPTWYGDPEDFVYTEEITSPRFFSLLPKELRPFATVVTTHDLIVQRASLPQLEAMPWGISPQSLHFLKSLQQKKNLNLKLPIWNDEYVRLTGRQTAAVCLEKIQELLPDITLPVTPKFCTKIREIEKYLILRNAPFVLKTPYSSSGRGLLWINDRKLSEKDKRWIAGAFNKQGTISIDCGLEKHTDFAMEFYSDGQGNVSYEGLSVFKTDNSGAYSGNVLGSKAYMESFFTNKFPDLFPRIKEAVRQAIQDLFGQLYTGYLGVDMLVYHTKDKRLAIHPCIEVNMRYTMGMTALRLSQKYLHPDAVGDFYVTFDSKAGEAYERHSFMKKAYPTAFVDGKLREGYIPLCPITKETSYRAYMLVM